MKEQFEKWVMVASSGNADLTLNIHGEYDSPETSGFYELYKLARADISQALTDMEVQLANAESKCRELAAENAGLKNPDNWLSQSDYGYEASEVATQNGATEDESLRAGMVAIINRIETPATDAFLAEVRAQARNEGINYAAGRLAAAFNHGFVDKPLTEVCDVVRMILDTKEELANSTLPAADGISGEYAEKFLAEFAAQLRKGAEL
jgi:hypothetical protein